METASQQNIWPVLKFEDLKDSLTTVQLWAQIVGKVRLCKMPWINHSWHVTLYVSARGLTTGSVPYQHGVFEIEFNFITHQLLISTSNNGSEAVKLQPRTVASFYSELLQKLALLAIDADIQAKPNEVEQAIPFAQDEVHKTYDKDQMHAYWKALVNVHVIFTRFRAGFTGKCSPVHLFWGAFDLAVTRFSGREAPLYSGKVPHMPLTVMQEAYSHEVCSAGFWPGSDAFPQPAFYAYCYPTPADFGEQTVQPAAAFYSTEMGEFFLTYDEVIKAADPGAALMQFLQSTYAAAAKTLNWDRHALDFNFKNE